MLNKYPLLSNENGLFVDSNVFFYSEIGIE